MPDNLPVADADNTTNIGHHSQLDLETVARTEVARDPAGGLDSRSLSVPASDMDTEMKVDGASSGSKNGRVVGSLPPITTTSATPSKAVPSSTSLPPSTPVPPSRPATLPEMILPTPSSSTLKPAVSTSASTSHPTVSNPPLPIDHRLTEPIDAFYKLQFLDPIDNTPDTASSSGAIRDGFSYYMQTLDVTIGRRVPKRDREKGKGKDPDKAGKQESSPESAVKQEHPASVEPATPAGLAQPIEDGVDDDVDAKFGKQFDDLVRLGLVDSPFLEEPDVDVKLEPMEGDSSSVPPVQAAETVVKQEQPEQDAPAIPITGPSPAAVPQTPEPTGADSKEVAEEPSDSAERQVDVDLGALKSVSRLHARIGYSYTLTQFYLEVLGRNGAWVDDVFAMRGTRIGLGPYTKIQISTRTFYFILPPQSVATYPIPPGSGGIPFPGSTTSASPSISHSIPLHASTSHAHAHTPNKERERDLHNLFRMPAAFNAFSLDAGPSEQQGSLGLGKKGLMQQWEAERRGLFGMERDGKRGWRLSRTRRRRLEAIEAEPDEAVRLVLLAEEERRMAKRRKGRKHRREFEDGGEEFRRDEERRLARAMDSDFGEDDDGGFSSSWSSSARSWSHCSSCSGSYDDDDWSSFSEDDEEAMRRELEDSDLSEESESDEDSSEEEALADKMEVDGDPLNQPSDSGSEIIAASDYEPEKTVPPLPAPNAMPVVQTIQPGPAIPRFTGPPPPVDLAHPDTPAFAQMPPPHLLPPYLPADIPPHLMAPHLVPDFLHTLPPNLDSIPGPHMAPNLAPMSIPPPPPPPPAALPLIRPPHPGPGASATQPMVRPAPVAPKKPSVPTLAPGPVPPPGILSVPAASVTAAPAAAATSSSSFAPKPTPAPPKKKSGTKKPPGPPVFFGPLNEADMIAKEAAIAAQKEATKIARRAADAERKRVAAAAKRERDRQAAAAAKAAMPDPPPVPIGAIPIPAAKPAKNQKAEDGINPLPGAATLPNQRPPPFVPSIAPGPPGSAGPSMPIRPGPPTANMIPRPPSMPMAVRPPAQGQPRPPGSSAPNGPPGTPATIARKLSATGQAAITQAQPNRPPLAPAVPGPARPPQTAQPGPSPSPVPSPQAPASSAPSIRAPVSGTAPTVLASHLPADSTIANGPQLAASASVAAASAALNKAPRLAPEPILGIDGRPFIGPEPLKPDLTYATIIYRALANIKGGRGTLGQVCDWVAGEWEWFRLNPEQSWQNSIRHNLSLNKAFLKVPRIETDDPESKGSVWILDPVHAPEYAEKERKAQELKEAKAKRDAEKALAPERPAPPPVPSKPVALVKPKKPLTPVSEKPPQLVSSPSANVSASPVQPSPAPTASVRPGPGASIPTGIVRPGPASVNGVIRPTTPAGTSVRPVAPGQSPSGVVRPPVAGSAPRPGAPMIRPGIPAGASARPGPGQVNARPNTMRPGVAPGSVRPASTTLPSGARPPTRPPTTGQVGQPGTPSARPPVNGQAARPSPSTRPPGVARPAAIPTARPMPPGTRPPANAARPPAAPRPALGARPPAARPPTGVVRPTAPVPGVRPPTARPAPAVPPKPAAIGGGRPPLVASTSGQGSLGKLPAAPANASGSLGSLNIPANKQFPIVVKPIPAHLRNSNLNTHSHILDGPPLVVDEGTIILNPSIFSHLTPDQLKHLQSLGAQQTLQILQAYIVQHLREKIRQQGANGAKGATTTGAAAKLGTAPTKAVGSASTATSSTPAGTAKSTAPTPTAPKPAAKANPATAKTPVKPPPAKAPLPANVANNPAIAALLSSAQQLAAKSGSTPASRSGSPAAQPPAETVRVIAQLAATAGNPSSASTPLTPNAVALLQYLRQVGAGANMTTAAHILATGVIPAGAIPPKATPSANTTPRPAAAKPVAPQSSTPPVSAPITANIAPTAAAKSGPPESAASPIPPAATPHALLAALNGVARPSPSVASPGATASPALPTANGTASPAQAVVQTSTPPPPGPSVLGKRSLDDTPSSPVNDPKRQKV